MIADLNGCFQRNPDILKDVCEHRVQMANFVLSFNEKDPVESAWYRSEIRHYKLYDVWSVTLMGQGVDSWPDLCHTTFVHHWTPMITETDLQFFETHYQAVENLGILNVFEDREDRIRFRAISKMMEDLLAPKKEKISLTEEEIQPIFREYLNAYTFDGKVKVFNRKIAAEGVQSFRKNPIATVMGIHGQLVYHDNCNHSIVKSFDRTGKTLKSMMSQYNELIGFERFKIDWHIKNCHRGASVPPIMP